MPTLGTRDDWRKLKEKYGIPDAVAKFSLGEKLGAFETAQKALAPGDHQKLIDALDGIIVLLDTYNKALVAMKPDKFGGKSASDKATNFTKAKAEVKGTLDIAKDWRDRTKMLALPMNHLSKHYAAVFAKFKALPKDNSGLATFYGQEIRNTLGLAVKTARKLPLGKDVLDALAKYEIFAENANKIFQSPGGDLAKARTELAKALAVLHEYMK
jgi:hypothetical protein